jgi:hypothetical protein
MRQVVTRVSQREAGQVAGVLQGSLLFQLVVCGHLLLIQAKSVVISAAVAWRQTQLQRYKQHTQQHLAPLLQQLLRRCCSLQPHG